MPTIRLCVVLLVVGLGCGKAVVASQGDSLTCAWAEVPVQVDGQLSEWDLSRFVRVTPASGVFDAESGRTEDPADLSFSFGVANDAEYLYVAVLVVDDLIVLDTNQNPADRQARAWMDDAVEIFLDGDHSHSPDARDSGKVEFRTGGEFSVVANGAVTSTMSGVPGTGGDPAYWTAAGSYAGPPGAAYQAPWDSLRRGYAVEARFRFRVMGEGAGPGRVIGFTVSTHDDDDGGGRDAALYWRGWSPSCWKNEAGWGTLQLALPPSTPVAPCTFGQVKDSLDP
jgi:hypothetical protein